MIGDIIPRSPESETRRGPPILPHPIVRQVQVCYQACATDSWRVSTLRLSSLDYTYEYKEEIVAVLKSSLSQNSHNNIPGCHYQVLNNITIKVKSAARCHPSRGPTINTIHTKKCVYTRVWRRPLREASPRPCLALIGVGSSEQWKDVRSCADRFYPR